MTTEQLKPCAHCDGLPLQAADTGLDYDHDTIVCDDCGATAPTAEAWNRRTPVEQLSAQTAVKTEQPSLSDADILELARGHWHNDAYHGDVCTIRFARALLSAQRQDSNLSDSAKEWQRRYDGMEVLFNGAKLVNEQYSDVLRGLASYVAAGGLNSEGLIPAETADAKIRWGIDHLQRQDSEQSRLMLADDTSPRIPQRQDSDTPAISEQCVSSSGPIGCYRVRCHLGKVCAAIANGAPK